MSKHGRTSVGGLAAVLFVGTLLMSLYDDFIFICVLERKNPKMMFISF